MCELRVRRRERESLAESSRLLVCILIDRRSRNTDNTWDGEAKEQEVFREETEGRRNPTASPD